jgi:hypothetical protein
VVGDPLQQLVVALWAERDLLRRLEFNLSVLAMMVRAQQWGWLSFADDEVRATSERLQSVEVLRAAHTDAVARQYGLGAEASLLEIAGHAPEPWPSILSDHREALRALAVAVDDAATATETEVRASAGGP